MSRASSAQRVLSVFLVAATILPTACSSPETESKSEPGSARPNDAAEQSFVDFWQDFRSAALENDVARVLSMTQLPFVTQGALDSDPSTAHDADSFRLIFPKLLQQDVGLSAQPEPMLEYLRRSTAPSVEGEQASVGQFRFAKIKGRWRLVSAYLEE